MNNFNKPISPQSALSTRMLNACGFLDLGDGHDLPILSLAQISASNLKRADLAVERAHRRTEAADRG